MIGYKVGGKLGKMKACTLIFVILAI